MSMRANVAPHVRVHLFTSTHCAWACVLETTHVSEARNATMGEARTPPLPQPPLDLSRPPRGS